MGHFAKVQDGHVTRVIIAEQDFIDAYDDGQPGAWVQTSYNTRGGVHYGQDGQPDGGQALRKNYAGVGYTYDKDRDAFIPPQPYPSWLLDEATCLWVAPIPRPDDGQDYTWDEVAGAWAVQSPAE